jgi:hypothetical protein
MAGKHMKGTNHHRVSNGHHGTFSASARGQTLIQGRQIGRCLVCAAAWASWTKVVRKGRFPLRVFPDRRLPARSSFPGATPTQAAKRLAAWVGHVNADLRHQHFCSPSVNSRDDIQPFHRAAQGHGRDRSPAVGTTPRPVGHAIVRCGRFLLTEGCQAALNGTTQGVDLFLQEIDVR